MNNNIFNAWYHLREAYEYMTRVETLERESLSTTYYKGEVEKHLATATAALGYDMVKRKAVKVEEAA